MTLNDYINQWALDALAHRLPDDADLQEETFGAIEWEGIDWQQCDRSTGSEAGYADAVPVDLWAISLMDELAEFPEGVELASAWTQRAAEELTVERLYVR